MAILAKHNETYFGVGDVVKVTQQINPEDKKQTQVFEGMVIAIRGSGKGKSFIVRRVGVQGVGIEKIFPLLSPSVVGVNVVRSGKEGVRRAKLYFSRGKSKKEIERIYSRITKKSQPIQKANNSSNKRKSTLKKKSTTNASSRKARNK